MAKQICSAVWLTDWVIPKGAFACPRGQPSARLRISYGFFKLQFLRYSNTLC